MKRLTKPNKLKFLSTPSGWRATTARIRAAQSHGGISIHALRVEGDYTANPSNSTNTNISIHALRVEGDLWHSVSALLVSISIHALRVEGDENRFYKPVQRVISIHALRVEGDRICSACQ